MCKIVLDTFAAASEDSFGNVSAIARRLGVARSTLYKFITSAPGARALLESHREAFDDVVEEKLQEKILEGDDKMLRLYLSARLSSRSKNVANKKSPPEFTVRVH